MQNFSEKLNDLDFLTDSHVVWPNDVTFKGEKKWWRKWRFLNSWLFTIESIYVYYIAGSMTKKKGALTQQLSGLFSFRQMKCCTHAGADVHYSGLHFLKGTEEKPAVIIANHMSMIETMLMPMICIPYNNVSFVIKKSLLKYPFIGTVLTYMDAIGVERKNPRDDLKVILKDGVKALKNGRSVVIFPQSTRSVAFDIKKFNTVGVKLARSAGVNIIPVALKTDFLSKGHILKDYGKVDPDKSIYITLGAPIEVTGNGREAQDKLVAFISEKVTKWGIPVVESSSSDNEI